MSDAQLRCLHSEVPISHTLEKQLGEDENVPTNDGLSPPAPVRHTFVFLSFSFVGGKMFKLSSIFWALAFPGSAVTFRTSWNWKMYTLIEVGKVFPWHEAVARKKKLTEKSLMNESEFNWNALAKKWRKKWGWNFSTRRFYFAQTHS